MPFNSRLFLFFLLKPTFTQSAYRENNSTRVTFSVSGLGEGKFEEEEEEEPRIERRRER
ncbi:hypothetical protein PIB30_106815, partial [Stylosanthes scabra]|nr:hypothetical protein [Stylosanthes scabra]